MDRQPAEFGKLACRCLVECLVQPTYSAARSSYQLGGWTAETEEFINSTMSPNRVAVSVHLQPPRWATAAPYIVDHSGGSTIVYRDQTVNGGKWNSLGAYSFGSENRTTRLSCWTSTGDIVIADAVHWVKQ